MKRIKNYSQRTETKVLDGRIELLSPGGSRDSVVAAVNCGCDAVYVGGKNFSARSAAENFDTAEELRNIVDYCHLRGVKVYLAINTLYKDRELDALLKFAGEAYSMGADAFILQDIGAYSLLGEVAPGIACHASTQMTAHSLGDVLFLQNAGFNRVVLSRELGLEEIARIAANCSVELEVFVHGALCYSYSGLCLMSSFYGDRSGNRGSCAQPCRLKYGLFRAGNEIIDGKHLLSPKDVSTLDFLEKIIEAGAVSLKIEGRLKSPEYVAIATEAYRAALDGLRGGEFKDRELYKKRVSGMFGRGGFSRGYFESHSEPELMSADSPKHRGAYAGAVSSYDRKTGICAFTAKTELVPGDGIEIRSSDGESCGAAINRTYRPNDKAAIEVRGDIQVGDRVYKSYDKSINDYAKKLCEGDRKKIDVAGTFRCVAGEPLALTLSRGSVSASVYGETAQKAEKQALSDERLIAQLSKSGAHPFNIQFSDYTNDGESFMSVASVNAARRAACEKFAGAIAESYRRETPVIGGVIKGEGKEEGKGERRRKSVSVSVSTREQLNAAMELDGIRRVYCELFPGFTENIERFSAAFKRKGAELFASLKSISRLDNSEALAALEKSGVSGYLARNMGQLEALKGGEKLLALDYSFNVSNGCSNRFFLKYADIVAPSVELSVDELSFCVSENELLVYGRETLMTTVLCPVGIYAGEKGSARHCRYRDSEKKFELVDRMGAVLPVATECGECYARILSDRPLFMLNKLAKLDSLGAGGYRLDFTTENAEETKKITAYALECLEKGFAVRDDEIKELIDRGISYGKYFGRS